MMPEARELLEWMTCHHLPLQIFRDEETGVWVVVTSTVLGSGETVYDALFRAWNDDHEKGG